MPAAGSGPVSISPPESAFGPTRLPVEPAVPVAALLPPVREASGEPPAIPFGSSTGTSVEPAAGAAIPGPGASRFPVSVASRTEVGPPAVVAPPDRRPGRVRVGGGLVPDVPGWVAALGAERGRATRTAGGRVGELRGGARGAPPVPVRRAGRRGG